MAFNEFQQGSGRTWYIQLALRALEHIRTRHGQHVPIPNRTSSRSTLSLCPFFHQSGMEQNMVLWNILNVIFMEISLASRDWTGSRMMRFTSLTLERGQQHSCIKLQCADTVATGPADRGQYWRGTSRTNQLRCCSVKRPTMAQGCGTDRAGATK